MSATSRNWFLAATAGLALLFGAMHSRSRSVAATGAAPAVFPKKIRAHARAAGEPLILTGRITPVVTAVVPVPADRVSLVAKLHEPLAAGAIIGFAESSDLVAAGGAAVPVQPAAAVATPEPAPVVDSSKLQQAEALAIQAETAMRNGEGSPLAVEQARRAVNLAREKQMEKQAAASARNAEEPAAVPLSPPRPGMVPVRAPARGVLVEQAPGRLGIAADPGVLAVYASLPSSELSQVREGQSVEIRVQGQSGPPLAGSVRSIGAVDAATGEYPVEIAVSNPRDRLFAPMAAKVLVSGTR